ncbi:hypothetical protein OVN18_02400 [Microcella daejeonensis]|uniref:Uncharacterized protein n=1 Tax=Microcella daejeonensis TaxID=2994971 RepID=A0A9E8S924_9MICO|nr:hypothetical protein [Microcella daejeonensis]WAB81893.1 hypothetical protein OVN18_02400 [Microcella daejeonensis]
MPDSLGSARAPPDDAPPRMTGAVLLARGLLVEPHDAAAGDTVAAGIASGASAAIALAALFRWAGRSRGGSRRGAPGAVGAARARGTAGRSGPAQ